MKRNLVAASLVLGASGFSLSANAYDPHTEYNGTYDLSCDTHTLTLAISGAFGLDTQTTGDILDGQTNDSGVINIPLGCEGSDFDRVVLDNTIGRWADDCPNLVWPNEDEKNAFCSTSTDFLYAFADGLRDVIVAPEADTFSLNVVGHFWTRIFFGADIGFYEYTDTEGNVVASQPRATDMKIWPDGRWSIYKLNNTQFDLPSVGLSEECAGVQTSRYGGNIGLDGENANLHGQYTATDVIVCGIPFVAGDANLLAGMSFTLKRSHTYSGPRVAD